MRGSTPVDLYWWDASVDMKVCPLNVHVLLAPCEMWRLHPVRVHWCWITVALCVAAAPESWKCTGVMNCWGERFLLLAELLEIHCLEKLTLWRVKIERWVVIVWMVVLTWEWWTGAMSVTWQYLAGPLQVFDDVWGDVNLFFSDFSVLNLLRSHTKV